MKKFKGTKQIESSHLKIIKKKKNKSKKKVFGEAKLKALSVPGIKPTLVEKIISADALNGDLTSAKVTGRKKLFLNKRGKPDGNSHSVADVQAQNQSKSEQTKRKSEATTSSSLHQEKKSKTQTQGPSEKDPKALKKKYNKNKDYSGSQNHVPKKNQRKGSKKTNKKNKVLQHKHQFDPTNSRVDTQTLKNESNKKKEKGENSNQKKQNDVMALDKKLQNTNNVGKNAQQNSNQKMKNHAKNLVKNTNKRKKTLLNKNASAKKPGAHSGADSSKKKPPKIESKGSESNCLMRAADNNLSEKYSGDFSKDLLKVLFGSGSKLSLAKSEDEYTFDKGSVYYEDLLSYKDTARYLPSMRAYKLGPIGCVGEFKILKEQLGTIAKDRLEKNKKVPQPKNITVTATEVEDDSSECPELVPIVDNELYDANMDSSSEEFNSSDYEECTDDDEECKDLLYKYTPKEDIDTAFTKSELERMKPGIIDAQNNVYDPELRASIINLCKSDSRPEVPTFDYDNAIRNCGPCEVITVPINDFPMTESQSDETISSTEYIDITIEESRPVISAIKRTKPSPELIQSKLFNAIDANLVLVLLNESICIYGTVRIVLIAGSIEIFGYTMKPGEERELFSPGGLGAIVVKPMAMTMKYKKDQLKEDLIPFKDYFSNKDLQAIVNNDSSSDGAVLVLKQNFKREKIVNNFKRFMNENVFPNMKNLKNDRPLITSEMLLNCMIEKHIENYPNELVINLDESLENGKIEPQSTNDLVLPLNWMQLKLEESSKVIIVGGKSVGKSTYLRSVVNRHVQQFGKILIIDLDIGQTELFVPQTISCSIIDQPLLGPGFILNVQPEKAYFIGRTSIVLCAFSYLRSVIKLLKYCHSREDLKSMPWLVNTMGYNKGFGMELISAICEHLRPTDIVQIQTTENINNYDRILTPKVLSTTPRNMYATNEFTSNNAHEFDYQVHVLMNVPLERSQRGMTAKDVRFAILLCRLTDALKGNAEYLTDCKPLRINLDEIKVINLLGLEYTREEILQSMEANIVFLCYFNDNEQEILECFGIGVVRCIDNHFNQLYILPAIDNALMVNVNCLAVSEMPLPTSMLINQGPKVKNMLPYVFDAVDMDASKSIKQIFYRPDAFLSGKHNDVL